jgi:ribosomal protein S18 acetylase RimI-like enzyme
MAISIRNIHGSDIPYLYSICLQTGENGNDASGLFRDPWLLGQYYVAPYVFYDSSTCFVLTDDNIPCGYIVSAADTRAFNHWLQSAWLPPLRLRYPEPYPAERAQSPTEAKIVTLLHQAPDPEPAWLPEYPAHLHIDLLSCVQGKGYGRILIERLCAELCGQNVPGLHLGVSQHNTGAITFYGKMGFSVLQNEAWGFILGKRFFPHCF